MIALGIVLAYFAVAVLATRPIYGYLRARSIDRNMTKYPALYRQGIRSWEKEDRPDTIVATLMLSILWVCMIFIPVFLGVKRYMLGTKVLSWQEIEAQRKSLSNRIGELERELGIK